MKHVALDCHFVDEQVQYGKIQVCHVSTKEQLTILLTKPLTHSKFTDLWCKIKVFYGNYILRGCNATKSTWPIQILILLLKLLDHVTWS